MRCLLRHRWEVIEQIGLVVVQRCRVCGKTRTRVCPVRTPDHPNGGDHHVQPR